VEKKHIEIGYLLEKVIGKKDNMKTPQQVLKGSYNRVVHSIREEEQRKAQSKLESLTESMMNGYLREKFEEIFEKDQEAIDGIRPSKSNRSGALLLWGLILSEIRKLKNDLQSNLQNSK
jgi:hypothetical protein